MTLAPIWAHAAHFGASDRSTGVDGRHALRREVEHGDQDVDQRADAEHERDGADSDVTAEGDADGQHDRLQHGAGQRAR